MRRSNKNRLFSSTEKTPALSEVHLTLTSGSVPSSPPSSVQLSSVAQSCPTLCNAMDCSTPGLPVHHQLPEFTQTHVH